MQPTAPIQRQTMDTQPATPATFSAPAWLTNAVTANTVTASTVISNPVTAAPVTSNTVTANTVTFNVLHKALLQQVPEFAAGQLTLLDCEIKRLRLRDGEECWSGTCLLTIQDASGAEPQTVALYSALIPEGQPEPEMQAKHHPFGTAQWRCYLPELRLALAMQSQGAKLTALSALTSPTAARRLLEESMQTSGNPAYHNLRIQSCQPQVMRYKPGSRCTILYHLAYPPALAHENHALDTWPDTVVAKTYHGGKGQIAYDGMVALWQSPLRSSPTVAIAEPLAYLPEARVLVQGPIRQEMTLKELVRKTWPTSDGQGTPERQGELYDYLRKTAMGLAELHHCGARCGEVVTWEDELADIYKSRTTLAAVLPQFTHFADDLLESLQRVAATHAADVTAPAHRSFRPAQVLLYKGEIGFIDFDGFCQAEPAMDLALFMTTIKHMAHMKHPVSKNHRVSKNQQAEESETPISEGQVAQLVQAEALCKFFLTEYEKHASVSHTRIALWETLQLLSLLLGSWKKLKLERLGYCRFMLERHLKRHGLG